MELHLERLPRTIELRRKGQGAILRFVDQRLLPAELRFVETASWREAVDAIKTLAVRGAPAIGVTGAAALALWAFARAQGDGAAPFCFEDFQEVARTVGESRPTAVNLMGGVRKAQDLGRELAEKGARADEAARALFDLVKRMEEEDERANRAIGEQGARLLGPDSALLTHCNAGSLATCFYGTALGVVYAAAAQGKVRRVYADETRPVGQGARLTVWELAQAGVPVTLLCDSMAASLMAQGAIDAVVVGADRIARNGDTANKIGTYGVALAAKAHGIPFYAAAPMATVDGHLDDGSAIVIEQRDSAEVLPCPIAGVEVMNPAFDVTPARLITAIITEKGVVKPADLHSWL